MRPENITVTVGEYTFSVPALPLGVIRKVEKLLRDKNIENLDRTIEIIRVFLEKFYPDLYAIGDDLVLPFDEIDSLASAILRNGGFLRKEGPSGEAPPLKEAGT